MRTRVGTTVAGVFLAAGLLSAGQGGTLSVTVEYTGPGEVDADHAVYLALYDRPNIGEASAPIGVATATANGEVVTFENVTASPVYLSAFFDENGGWDGLSAPPSGSPASTYRAGAFPATPIEVAGGTVDVEFSFADAFRMP